MAQDIDAVRLQLAFSRLSNYVSETFPDILPLELFTIGGAVIVTVIGSRMTTQDVASSNFTRSMVTDIHLFKVNSSLSYRWYMKTY